MCDRKVQTPRGRLPVSGAEVAGAEGAASGFAWGARFDGQRMNTLRQQGAKGIIHKAMSGRSAQSGKACAADAHRPVPAFAGADMARVLAAVVQHFQGLGAQRLAQAGFDLDATQPVSGARVRAVGGAHGLAGGTKSMAAELMQ